MFRLDMSECGKKVELFHLHPVKEKAVINPFVLAVHSNHAGHTKLPFDGASCCISVFKKLVIHTKYGFAHFFINGRGISAEKLFSQELRLAIA